jgi:predicted component of viral defense system (DUF524 family)
MATRRLQLARQRSEYLRDVGELEEAPSRVTMVLLRRPEYRALYASYLAFQRRLSVRLDAGALDAPLRELPYLYQLWCTLVVIDVFVQLAELNGYRLVSQQLLGRDARGSYLRLLPNGQPAVVVRSPTDLSCLRLIPERTYGPQATGIHSVSFSQRPDIAIEREDSMGMQVIVLDPKYKLLGEQGGLGSDASPLKGDIDKMHAYRDSVRSGVDRVVSFASIMYPGSQRIYDGVGALQALPSRQDDLRSSLGACLQRLIY